MRDIALVYWHSLWCQLTEVEWYKKHGVAGTQKQPSWDSFEFGQVNWSASTIMDCCLWWTLGEMMLGILRSVLVGHSFLCNIALVIGPAIIYFMTKTCKKDVVSGTQVLVMAFAVASVCCCVSALWAPSTLQAHRIFLTTEPLIFFLMTVVFYIPMPAFVGICCPIHCCTWWIFHYITGYSCFPFPPIAHCMLLACGVKPLLDKKAWGRFRAMLELDMERQELQRTQDVLRDLLSSVHGVLASVFDASCTCDASGDIQFSSMQFNQLLGGGTDKKGMVLSSLAKDTQESDRLNNFVKQVSEHGTKRALTIQASLQQYDAHAGGDETSILSVREVVMYGIKLPACAISSGRVGYEDWEAIAHGDASLFIGLQECSAQLEQMMSVKEATPQSRRQSKQLQQHVSFAHDVEEYAVGAGQGSSMCCSSVCSESEPGVFAFQCGNEQAKRSLARKGYALSSKYLKEHILSTLQDLALGLNLAEEGCCLWHANLIILREWIAELKDWQSCDYEPPAGLTWQCSDCTMISNTEAMPDAAEPSCWLCGGG